MKIGDHDLMIKINHARQFLKEGNKVQFTLQFRGREDGPFGSGPGHLQEDKGGAFRLARSSVTPRWKGGGMTLVLQPDHKQPGAKPPGKAGTADRFQPAATDSRRCWKQAQYSRASPAPVMAPAPVPATR